MRKIVYYEGQKIGMRILVKRISRGLWQVKCSCGKLNVVRASGIRKGILTGKFSCPNCRWQCQRKYINEDAQHFYLHLKGKLGLSKEQVDQIIIDNCGKCFHCGRQLNDLNIPTFDHNHMTGKFRSLVCHPCNITMGYIETHKDWWPSLMNTYARQWSSND